MGRLSVEGEDGLESGGWEFEDDAVVLGCCSHGRSYIAVVHADVCVTAAIDRLNDVAVLVGIHCNHRRLDECDPFQDDSGIDQRRIAHIEDNVDLLRGNNYHLDSGPRFENCLAGCESDRNIHHLASGSHLTSTPGTKTAEVPEFFPVSSICWVQPCLWGLRDSKIHRSLLVVDGNTVQLCPMIVEVLRQQIACELSRHWLVRTSWHFVTGAAFLCRK